MAPKNEVWLQSILILTSKVIGSNVIIGGVDDEGGWWEGETISSPQVQRKAQPTHHNYHPRNVYHTKNPIPQLASPCQWTPLYTPLTTLRHAPPTPPPVRSVPQVTDRKPWPSWNWPNEIIVAKRSVAASVRLLCLQVRVASEVLKAQ